MGQLWNTGQAQGERSTFPGRKVAALCASEIRIEIPESSSPDAIPIIQMKQVLEIEESVSKEQEDIARSWYRKSHNHYQPAEQITRDYKKPFDKFDIFGKPTKKLESRIRRILTWINHEPITLVDRQQADFTKRTRSIVGRIK
ncbi:uncharacterized protein LOC126859114 isoform X2 [Cataglyphis hispanica]|uniref:uncharacterized protein LOC126859114 isoform X2 n=1 Tax=Cataglyphis hispanica TaxID=1086592 RepID=UPI0021805A7B|nr:uncharacterized protein LOC126859114 isoform X2 [Cataglyphis hispanica]